MIVLMIIIDTDNKMPKYFFYRIDGYGYFF